MNIALVSTVMSAQLGQAAPAVAGAGSPMEHAMGLAGSSLGTVGFLCGVLALKVSFIGMALWVRAMYPQAAERILETYQRPGNRCFWVGFVNGVLGAFVAVTLMATGVLSPLGFLLAAGLLALIALGYGAAYRNLGLRLFPLVEVKSSALNLVAGGAVAEAAFLFPLLGQLLSLGVLFRGLGAAVLVMLAMRRDKRAKAAVAPIAESAPVPGVSSE